MKITLLCCIYCVYQFAISPEIQFFCSHAGVEEPGTLMENDDNNFLAFLRRIGTVYYQKHKSAFESNGPGQ